MVEVLGGCYGGDGGGVEDGAGSISGGCGVW